MSALLPPPDETLLRRLFEAADGLTKRNGARPPVFLIGGNSAGLLSFLASGGLEVPGVKVVRFDQVDQRGPSAVPEDLVAKMVPAIGEGLELVVPGLAFASSLGELGRNLFQKWRSVASDQLTPSSPVIDTLNAVRDAYPATVVVLGDISVPGAQVVWEAVLYWARVSQHHPNRLMFVAQLGRNYGSDPIGLTGLTDGLVGSIRTAVEARRVEWYWLEPLTDHRLTRWLGQVDDDLRDALLALSGRSDLKASQIWQEWNRVGYVAQRAGVWETTGVEEPLLQVLEGLFRERLDGVVGEIWTGHSARQIAMNCLELAALSGSTFSGSAVAAVIAHEVEDLEKSDVEELLDLLGDEGEERWIVATDGEHVEVQGEFHWRYRFASRLIASTLRSFSDRDAKIGWVPTKVLADRLYNEAVRIHGAAPIFEDSLFHLAAVAGDEERMNIFERRLANSEARRTVSARAYLYLSMAEPDPLWIDEMIVTTIQLTNEDAFVLSVELGRLAVAHARAVGSESQEAWAGSAYGRALARSDQLSSAVDVLKTAVNQLTQIHEVAPERQTKRRLATTLNDLVLALLGRGDPDAAEGSAVQAVKLQEQLLQMEPSSSDLRQELSIGLAGLGRAVSYAGRPADAVEPLSRSLEMGRALLAQNPSSEGRLFATALGQKDLAAALRAAGQHRAAEELLVDSVGIYERLLELDPTAATCWRSLAVCLRELGQTIRVAGRPEEAQDPLTRSVNLWDSLLKQEPLSGIYLRGLAVALGEASRAGLMKGSLFDAEQALVRAVETWDTLTRLNPSSPIVLSSLAGGLTELGQLILAAGRPEDAKQPLLRAVQLRAQLAESHPSSMTASQLAEAQAALLAYANLDDSKGNDR